MKNKSIYLITTHNGQHNFSFSYQGQVFQGWILTKFPGFQRLLIWLFGVFSSRYNYQTLSMSLCKRKWQSVLNPTIAIYIACPCFHIVQATHPLFLCHILCAALPNIFKLCRLSYLGILVTESNRNKLCVLCNKRHQLYWGLALVFLC